MSDSTIYLRYLLFLLLFASAYYLCVRWPSRLTSSGQTHSQSEELFTEEAITPVPKHVGNIGLIKELYYKLQHLEDFPEVLPEAWKLLQCMINETLLLGRYKATTQRSILHVKKFDATTLKTFLDAELADTMNEWEAYVGRRKAGGPREKFVDVKDAHTWLKNLAPLNYIDGAWVCRIHKITTPFPLRRVTKDAWQTYSEEMGDGDLGKNHVHIYRRLMRDINAGLPASDDPDFIHSRHGVDELSYKGATSHLLVSLFPNEFLPEILGFNLQFEAPSLGSLQAMKELAELKIDPEYFILHISIDNADSGHSAMAYATVLRFMDIVRKTGLMNCDEAWRRIQAGYLLAQNAESEVTVQDYEKTVAEMLERKAGLARKIHCTSRVRIGKRSLSDWFTSDWRKGEQEAKGADEESLDWKQEFLTALADATPWVRRGNSEKSLLMRELAWKGRMFGAFTDNEVELMRTWINSLKADGGTSGESHSTVANKNGSRTSFDLLSQDPASFHPAMAPQRDIPSSEKHGHVLTPRQPLSSGGSVRLGVILPLWFAHPCLLENMVNSPHQMANPLESKVLQILRVDYAYKPDAKGVAGMDEHLPSGTTPDLIALGLAIVRKQGLPEPSCLGDVLANDNAGAEECSATDFAFAMLSWAMRPNANGMFLIGLARAFLDFEIFVASREDLLLKKEQATLQQMVERKTVYFEACMNEVALDIEKCREVVAGYEYGRDELETLLAQ